MKTKATEKDTDSGQSGMPTDPPQKDAGSNLRHPDGISERSSLETEHSASPQTNSQADREDTKNYRPSEIAPSVLREKILKEVWDYCRVEGLVDFEAERQHIRFIVLSAIDKALAQNEDRIETLRHDLSSALDVIEVKIKRLKEFKCVVHGEVEQYCEVCVENEVRKVLLSARGKVEEMIDDYSNNIRGEVNIQIEAGRLTKDDGYDITTGHSLSELHVRDSAMTDNKKLEMLHWIIGREILTKLLSSLGETAEKDDGDKK